MNTTQETIARRLGISRRSVSYALNGNGRVSEGMRLRVLELAEELNHQPNQAARTLATGRSHIVALRLPGLDSPYNMRVLATLQRLTEAAGYDLVVKDSYASRPSQWPLDGCIALDPMTHEQSERNSQGIPEVALGCYAHQAAPDADYIGCDLFSGAQQAFDHLWDAGCRRIAFFSEKSLIREGEPRLLTYRSRTGQHGVKAEEIILPSQVRFQFSSCQMLHGYIQEHGAPDGLLCLNDDVAMGACRALRKLGLDVPSQVKVVGCDGTAEAGDHEPPLSTVEFPYEEMCHRAWKALLNRIEHPDVEPQRSLLQPSFIIRASSRKEPLQGTS